MVMRIAYFTDTFLPQVNGIATSIANISASLGEKGHEIVIFAPKTKGIKRKFFYAKNVTVIYLSSIPIYVYPEFRLGIFALPKILKVLATFTPDIIHFHTPATVGLDALLAAKILKKPLVGTFHAYLTNPEYIGWIKSRLAVLTISEFVLNFCRILYNACDVQLAPSKSLIKELYQVGYKKPIVYFPNSVALEKLKRLSAEEKLSHKRRLKLKEKVVLHFGRISQEKKIEHIIYAFGLLLKRMSGVSLLIIGDGPAKNDLKKLVAKLHLKKQIVFMNFISHQDLMSSGILSIADLFVTASTMENQPMVVLEAMGVGLPIVAIKKAVMRELVGNNGLLAEDNPSDLAVKMEKILKNSTLQRKMSKESLKKVQQYSAEHLANKLVALYQSIGKV